MKKAPPYLQANAEDADIYALQALARGEASEHQQKRVLDWIVNSACMTYDLPWFPGVAGANDFACGRQFVGKRIVSLIKLNMAAVKKNQIDKG